MGSGTVGIKWVPFRRDFFAFALKVEACYPAIIWPMWYALFDIKNKVTLYFPFGVNFLFVGVGCTIPFGNIKEDRFIKYLTMSIGYGFSNFPSGAYYHETNIGIGVRWIK
ncbi:MAG: hypothetical protein HY769_06045 [Candidatus Stahlbacteria bacterium]|nr:hypothetical protein [Candidatus Stahlbacteria bacterium]